MTKSFYTSFRDCVINSDIDNMDETDRRVVFQMEMYKMIPKSHHKLLFSVMRSYPTPVIYAFLITSIISWNYSNFHGIERKSSDWRFSSIISRNFRKFPLIYLYFTQYIYPPISTYLVARSK